MEKGNAFSFRMRIPSVSRASAIIITITNAYKEISTHIMLFNATAISMPLA